MIEILRQADLSEDKKYIKPRLYRHFGFGGRILAAPFLNMFYEWYEEYQKEIDKTL